MDRLVAALTKLAAAFPQANATEATLAVYVEQLASLEQDTLIASIDSLIAHSHRFPTVAEIRDTYTGMRKREALTSGTPALPIGREPMPEYVRKQIAEMTGAFEARSKQLEEETERKLERRAERKTAP